MTAESRSHEAALVRSAQAGDRAAFGALYQQYRPVIHGIMLAHAEFHAAEDLMQDTFVKALEQLPTLRDAATFRRLGHGDCATHGNGPSSAPEARTAGKKDYAGRPGTRPRGVCGARSD